MQPWLASLVWMEERRGRSFCLHGRVGVIRSTLPRSSSSFAENARRRRRRPFFVRSNLFLISFGRGGVFLTAKEEGRKGRRFFDIARSLALQCNGWLCLLVRSSFVRCFGCRMGTEGREGLAERRKEGEEYEPYRKDASHSVAPPSSLPHLTHTLSLLAWLEKRERKEGWAIDTQTCNTTRWIGFGVF